MKSDLYWALKGIGINIETRLSLEHTIIIGYLLAGLFVLNFYFLCTCSTEKKSRRNVTKIGQYCLSILFWPLFLIFWLKGEIR